MSKRQDIVTAFLTQLQTISLANGYSRDYIYIGEWLLNVTEEEINNYVPAILLVDDSQDCIYDNHQKHMDFILHLVVVIWCAGSDSLTILRSSIADVYKCIGADETLNTIVWEITPIDDVMNLVQKENIYGDAEIKIDVKYSCDAWDI